MGCCSAGLEKVRKRYAQMDSPCIGSAHKVDWNYFWADSTRCRHRHWSTCTDHSKNRRSEWKGYRVGLESGMLEVANEEAAYQGLTNVVFQVVKDENLSMFPDNTFDSVVCRNGLTFMPDPVKAFKAFLRVLKPGRKASVTVWGSPDKSPVMGVVMKTISRHVPDFKQPSASAAAPPGTPGGAFSIPTVDMLHDYFLKAG